MAKVLFIVGAGASRSTGTPVMNGFLDRAHELLWMSGTPVAKDHFERVFTVIAGLQVLHAKSKTDLQNVESIFNLIEMAQLVRRLPSLDVNQIGPAADSIRVLLAQTIELSCRFPLENHRVLPPVAYLELASWLKRYRAESLNQTSPWVFLTFNYDIALDYALHYSGLGGLDYGLQPKGPDPRGVPLLKLHGSLNWTLCGCGKEIAVLPFDNFVSNAIYDEIDNATAYLRPTRFLGQARPCEMVPAGLPAIVPPSWNKTQYQQTFRRVWERAAVELAEAENIVVIGYSLPQTDAFFRDLFQLSAAGPTRVKRFVVISPDAAAHERFREMLGPELEQRFESRLENFESAVRWITTTEW